MVKNLPTNAGDVGWEDSLEKEMATHSSLGNPMDRGAWRGSVQGPQRVG